MDDATYFRQLIAGLATTFGTPRFVRNGARFGAIGLEYECVGPTMIVFLATINWMRTFSWDGAVHIDMRTISPTQAVPDVRKMVETGLRYASLSS